MDVNQSRGSGALLGVVKLAGFTTKGKFVPSRPLCLILFVSFILSQYATTEQVVCSTAQNSESGVREQCSFTEKHPYPTSRSQKKEIRRKYPGLATD